METDIHDPLKRNSVSSSNPLGTRVSLSYHPRESIDDIEFTNEALEHDFDHNNSKITLNGIKNSFYRCIGIKYDVEPTLSVPDNNKIYGHKRFTWLDTFTLTLNNAMGPAMVSFPLMFQQSGWLVPFIMFSIFFIVSTLACTMLCEVIQRIPGNRNFNRRVELCDLVEYFFGYRLYIFSQVVMYLALQASNLSAMIVSATVLDGFFVEVANHTYGVVYTNGLSFQQSEGLVRDPWNGEDNVILLGVFFVMAFCIPFSWLNLDDNILFQWFSLLLFSVFTVEFYIHFVANIWFDGLGPEGPNGNTANGGGGMGPGSSSTPFFTSWFWQGQVPGTVIFAYAYVLTIPSWLNEKKRNVNVNTSLWVPGISSYILKVTVGVLGAWAFLCVNEATLCPVRNADNFLQFLIDRKSAPISKWSAYLWNIGTITSGIPILAIVSRYNLSKIMDHRISLFLGVILPWIICIFTYERQLLQTICSWTGNLVLGFMNFVVPIVLYYCSHKYPNGHVNEMSMLHQPLVDHERDLTESDVDSGLVTCESSLTTIPESWGEQMAFENSNDIEIIDQSESGALCCFAPADDPSRLRDHEVVHAIPEWVHRYVVSKPVFALVLTLFLLVCTLVTLSLQIWTTVGSKCASAN